jgi:hypothetical protein
VEEWREVAERRKRVGQRWGKNEGDRRYRKKVGEGRKESRERERIRGVGEDYPCPPPHRFRDSFCLFGITNAHHTPVIWKLTKSPSPLFDVANKAKDQDERVERR